jgi:hypothetical protein
MSDIVVAILNGWGASSRRKFSRTNSMVERALDAHGLRSTILPRRAHLLYSRVRKFRRFIRKNQDEAKILLCVGKSLGARNMVVALNGLGPVKYKRAALLTIDPNWPTWTDLRPNLNRRVLHLQSATRFKTFNVYIVGQPGQQAGAMLSGPDVQNIPILNHDHISVVRSPEVKIALFDLIRYLTK